MKVHFFAAPVLLAAIFAQGAFAQTPSTRPDPAARHAQMLTRMLALSTDQQTQVQSLISAAETSISPLQAQLKTLRTSLITAIKTNDAGGINAITLQMEAPRQQADVIRATTAAKIYALLTPDQQTKVNNAVEMLAGMGGGMGRGFDGGGMRHGRPPR